MTDDWRQDCEVNPWSTPRAYHFYKVVFTVIKKETDEQISMPFFISAKRSYQWLEGIMHGRYYLPLPSQWFRFEWKLYEVEDRDDIVFHHITTKEQWERVSIEYVLATALSRTWREPLSKKITKILKKIQTFLANRLFIYRKAKIQVYG